jgi:hypothetical protein
MVAENGLIINDNCKAITTLAAFLKQITATDTG